MMSSTFAKSQYKPIDITLIVKELRRTVDREAAARELVAQGKVFELVGQAGAYVVANGKGRAYLVTERGCTRPDYAYRGGPCKH